MRIFDLEMSEDLSEAFFNPQASSFFREPGLLDYATLAARLERARAGVGATRGGRKKTEPKRGHRNGRPGQYGQRETSDVATRPLGHRQKRRSPGIYSWSPPVSEPKSLADQIANHQGALTAKELSELLAISPILLYKMAKTGRIPSLRIGSCVRFCPGTIARWLRVHGA